MDKLWYYPELRQPTEESKQSEDEKSDSELTVATIQMKMKEKVKQKRTKTEGKLTQLRPAKKPKSTKKQTVMQVDPGQRSLLTFIDFSKRK